VALLAVSSLACGAATNGEMLIVARVGQGVAGAMLLPAALALLTDTFTERRERRLAVATWSAIGGTGATAGLLLGGLATAGLGWRWVLLINVPVCLVLLVVAPLVLTERVASHRQDRLDLPGFACFSIGIAAVLYASSQLSSAGWSGWQVLGPATVGVALLGGFAMVQRRGRHPLLPRRLLHSPAVLAGNATLLVAGMCGIGMGAAFVGGSVESLDIADEHDRGAAALQNICFALGTALGVAILSSVAASAGHLGGTVLAAADPAELLTGVRAALWTACGLAISGLLIGIVRRRPRAGNAPLPTKR
jgi:MFS family permease